jgi:cytochrome b6-f complex iron-sulfur subunit
MKSGAAASAPMREIKRLRKAKRMATAGRAALDRSPDLEADGVTRRSTLQWMTLAWIGFGAATAAGLTATMRFMFPNVLFEPPTRFKAGSPSSYGLGVDERWKEKYGVWIVRNSDSIYALVAVCTHLGCTPNWLPAQQKFKCPCHGSGYYVSGINFEGPTPRPLERAEIEISPDDGQIVVDKAVRFLYERGQWSDPKALIHLT